MTNQWSVVELEEKLGQAKPKQTQIIALKLYISQYLILPLVQQIIIHELFQNKIK
jgi:hypothetical protein